MRYRTNLWSHCQTRKNKNKPTFLPQNKENEILYEPLKSLRKGFKKSFVFEKFPIERSKIKFGWKM